MLEVAAVDVPVVEMVEVVNVVVLLGVVDEVVSVVEVVCSDIVPVVGRGGRMDTIKVLVVVWDIVDLSMCRYDVEEKMKMEKEGRTEFGGGNVPSETG